MNEQQQADNNKEKFVRDERNSLSLFTPIEGRSLPDNFKMGRAYLTQAYKIEPTLFDSLVENDVNNYVYASSRLNQLSETDLAAFSYAVGQILYNQSYLTGNENTNSGLTLRRAENFSKKTGTTRYYGDIQVTLNEICRLGYGVDEVSTQQRKAMEAVIAALDTSPVDLHFPNGDKGTMKLCTTLETYERATDKAKSYHLLLNPLFCENVTNNFAELPQDTMKRLSVALKERKQRKSVAHIRLLQLLSIQDKRKPFRISIINLVSKVGLLDIFKKQRVRTEKQLLTMFQLMKDIGIILDLPTEGVGADGVKDYSFTFNTEFTKRQQRTLPQMNE